VHEWNLHHVEDYIFHRAAIGEAAGLLFVTASAGSTSVAVLAAVLDGCFVATAGYTMVVFIQHRSCHGLHYFAGVSDWKHAKGERGGYLWQVCSGRFTGGAARHTLRCCGTGVHPMTLSQP